MIRDIFFVWWFFGPAGLANVAAFASGKIAVLKKFTYPADFYIKFRGKRLLGTHKTIRGFLVGILVAIAVVYLEIYLYNEFAFARMIIPINYNTINPVLFGTLAGFGALFGDALKSFFKRQRNISPGKSWVPFDQIDYIVGGIVFTSLYIRLSLYDYVLLFVVYVLLHPSLNFLAFLLRLKKSPL